MGQEDNENLWEVVNDPNVGRSPFAVKILVEGMEVNTVRLDPEVTYIGRMPENHIVLDDPKVSRSHARIVKKDGRYVLQDQESENGMYLKGKRVPEVTLDLGTKVVIGSHILEVVSAEDVNAQSAERESHMDGAEEEEWRNDSTIAGATVDLDQLRERMRKEAAAKAAKQKSPQKKKTAATKIKAPKLKFTLEIGDRTIEDEIRFAKGRRRTNGDQDELWVKIGVGDWFLEKKVLLKKP